MGFEGTHDKIKILDTSHFGYRDLLLPNGYISSIPENNPPYVLWSFNGKNMYIAGACIALGIKLQLPIYTADRVWKELQLEGTDIKLIR